MPISHLYSNVGRQALTKTFTHGYAQSVVAATHPASYPNHHQRTNLHRRHGRIGRVSSYQLQNAFHNSVSSPSASIQDGRLEKKVTSDGGLEAYFDAWQKHHDAGAPEQEWRQFQFAKRIEWKAPAQVLDSTAEDEQPSLVHTRSGLHRTKSEGDLELRKIQDEPAALLTVNDEIAEEIKLLHSQALEHAAAVAGVPTPPFAPIQSPALTIESNLQPSPSTIGSIINSDSDSRAQNYAEILTNLSEARRFAEIPAVFQTMVGRGIQPLTASYNALLTSAVHHSTEKTYVVPKVLEVYTSMLRQKVLPDTTTYSIVINALTSRSIELSLMKKALEEKRLRFGGMKETGKFMFASHEIDLEILTEEDRLDLAIELFSTSTSGNQDRFFPALTYLNLISASAASGRVPDMIRFFEHMESSKVRPLTATFPLMIRGFTKLGNLKSAVECYDKYKALAISDDEGKIEMADRDDSSVYAAVVKAYVDSDKLPGAMEFYKKIADAYGLRFTSMKDLLISQGFLQGMLDRGKPTEALRWVEGLDLSSKATAMANIAGVSADQGDRSTAMSAFDNLPFGFHDSATPAIALLALCVREGDVISASRYWHFLSAPEVQVTSAFIEPTAMYSVALIGSGQVMEGLVQAEQMFARIKASAPQAADEVDEGIEFVSQFMADRGIVDPRAVPQSSVIYQQPFTPTPYAAPVAQTTYEDSYDPYAASTDFKGSALIAEDLEKGNGGRNKTSRLNEALGRFRNIRRAGRHPRYITYAKLISAAAREERINLVHDILGMARSDIPLLTQYPIVRYGWVSILDAMVGACLTLGNRALATQYHQELLDMGAAPTANTFGLYITTLKESTKTFDEASEAVKIFHRAKAEGVEPSSFLYNALIGKLGKARRIDDCLFYFAQMRSLGIRPTSVTYGTIVNALCRVSDENFAEELFEEMESMPNYKARPAPYNSLMQFFLTTKRDKTKVLAYYERMKSKGIQPTNHTYKLLVDTHATLEPVNMAAAEAVLDVIRSTGQKPEAVHYASLIHAKGCVLHDMDGARVVFDSVAADPEIRPQACIYQALFEAMVANHRVSETEPILRDMASKRVEITPYIANTLIHGWANEKDIEKSKKIFAAVGCEKREPSTYEAMTRAFLAVEDRQSAKEVVEEMLGRGYPHAVSSKIVELVGGGYSDAS